ncbi:MAG: 6-phosphogluconolactonase [Lentisphaerae bacterium GWF2_45_14]|nr:MAG: 6-phosphogluconolactonase [Lentisphaerae bacterium GWF2_45_14]
MNIDEISLAVANVIAEKALEKDCLTLAVSGGSTPERLFSILAATPINWSKVHVFWVDERFVPVDSEFNNYGKAYELWLSKIDIPPENIHRMKTEKASAIESARDYEKELEGFFKTPLPSFDIVLLGMGDDGHTASLFPGSPALNEKKRAVISVPAPTTAKPAAERITLTFPAINNSAQKIFIISGEKKKAMTLDINKYPAGRVLNAEYFIAS